MDDASLDEFTDAEGDEADPGDGEGDDFGSANDEGTGDGETEAGVADAAVAEPDGVSPAVSTYAWTGDSPGCAACGEPADRQWRDGDALVCADCKEW